jgi:hypothetical protein
MLLKDDICIFLNFQKASGRRLAGHSIVYD